MVILREYGIIKNMAQYKIKDGEELRIAISGKSGCGNTTVSTMIAERLGIKLINYTFRNLAKERGISFEEIIEKAKTDFSYDKYVDTQQVELAKEESCVLGSRLAIWMLEEADVKIYLYANEDVRAKRIFEREGGDLEKIKAFTLMRDSEDTRRYKELYGIDNSTYEGVADIVIDSEFYSAEEIVSLIFAELEMLEMITLVE